MPTEREHGEFSRGEEVHDVVLGKSFMPFGKEHGFRDPLRNPADTVIEEPYEYDLYLRKKINLRGIEGYIDVIDESPHAIFEILDLMRRNVRIFRDNPLGSVDTQEIKLTEDDWVNTSAPLVMRFSFMLNNPAEYTKLLSTYADVSIGEEMFFLTVNFNELSVEKGMALLSEGKKGIIEEKNLFNYKYFEELSDKHDQQTLNLRDNIGRFCFVKLPKDFEQLRKISVTFRSGFKDDDVDTLIPIEPQKSPVNV